MEQGIIYYPNRTEKTVRPAKGQKFSLEELQAAVEGDIELVPMGRGNGHATMYCNEEGRLKGMKHNEMATALAAADLIGDIVGPAIVVRKVKKETNGKH